VSVQHSFQEGASYEEEPAGHQCGCVTGFWPVGSVHSSYTFAALTGTWGWLTHCNGCKSPWSVCHRQLPRKPGTLPAQDGCLVDRWMAVQPDDARSASAIKNATKLYTHTDNIPSEQRTRLSIICLTVQCSCLLEDGPKTQATWPARQYHSS
jgi:hypothetical protein